uniref:BCAS3 WD40 domain-containing protein n=1 Tax=Melanopsichium pennsylvanicum 4 TaxID=1398559 RepID=A0A077R501_9BASI|nr:conserved hypothetical protein [Melanopsichium pennsylvanicum 4]
MSPRSNDNNASSTEQKKKNDSSPLPTSAIDTVTATISALSQHANRGISNLIAAGHIAPNPASPPLAASADQSTPLRSNGSISPIYDAFHNAGSPPDPVRIEAAILHAHQSEQPARALPPNVLWSRWDRLPLKTNPLKWAPLLVYYFDDGTLQALLVQDRRISELLCLPHAAESLHGQSPPSIRSAARILTALVRHPVADMSDPQLLLVLQEPDQSTSLLAYSLAAHQVQASVHLQHRSTHAHNMANNVDAPRKDLWPAVESQCNERFLVLSFAAPASIHVLSTSTLEYLHSPILDISAATVERPSPISLSHRLLAFACTASDDLSPIHSDTRKISKASYHDPSQTFAAAGQGDASGRVGEMRDNLFETSAHVGDAARRIRGGVMSGVRTLGEWGSSYWPQAGSPPTTAAFSPPQFSLLSQSAPYTARSPRAASSNSISPMLLAADNGRSAKRLSAGAATATLPKAEKATNASHSPNAVQAGSIRVVDLGSDARTICTFSPSSNAVALISFSPCGRLILTADVLGHAFHIFELPFLGKFGNAGSASPSAVLHRYKLMRGITTADVVHAQWSPDAQWVTVGTRSGTVHVYAINSFGGAPFIDNHVQHKVRNAQVFQPLSVSLTSFSRSSRPPPPLQHGALAKPANGAGGQISSLTAAPAQIGSAPPSFLLISRGTRAADIEGEASTPFELFTNDPGRVSVTLHAARCWSTQTRASSASISNEEAHATGPESKQQRFLTATSPRPSGLSQMMRKAGEGLLHGQQVPRLQVECACIAVWNQMAPEPGAVTKQSVDALSDQTSTACSPVRSEMSLLLKPMASVAKAEIETYSQSPTILPASIILSRQTFFHARLRVNEPSLGQVGSEESMRCVQRRGSRPIQVRKTARLVSREPSSEDPSSFDDSLAGALNQMSFDPEKLPPRSATAHIPSFPQGQRGRSSGWTTGSSIPIRIVAGGLGGIYRAGKELGRGVEMARLRTSGASATVPPDGTTGYSRTAASISFDGVDDVDLLGEDVESTRASHRHYRMSNGIGSQPDHGSTRSDTFSLLSALRNDGPSRSSQSSSAETPSTRFSEAEDPTTDGLEANECEWDAIEASRSPIAPEAPIFGIADDVQRGRQEDKEFKDASARHGGISLDDDFSVGMLEEDSEGATTTHSRSSLVPVQGFKSKGRTPKELVYALPAGASTRSSLLSQSSGLTTTLDGRVEGKVIQQSPRNSSPSTSDGGDSGSHTSTGSGMLCEGSKEMHTTDSSPMSIFAELEEGSLKGNESELLQVPAAAKSETTSDGGKKKKKKGGR